MSNVQTTVGSQQRSRTQKRWHDRLTKPEMAMLSYSDKSGRSRTHKARILDISKLGMSVTLPDQLDLRSFVHINCPPLKLNGQASVRRQLQQGAKYTTGLEFVGGLFYVEQRDDS